MTGVYPAAVGALCALLLVLPGLALAPLFAPRHAAERLAFSVVLSALLGCLAFWAYLASPLLGKACTLLVMAGAAIAVTRQWLGGDDQLRSRDLRTVLCLYLLVPAFYCSALNLAPFAGTQGELANQFFFPQWSDNLFQGAAAGRLLHGEPVLNFNGWNLAERPPLQAGLILLTGAAVGGEAWWQGLGVAANSAWVLVLAYLGVLVGLERRAIGRVLVLCVAVGFFFNSSVFVWPKMLGGALVVLGAALWWYAGTGAGMRNRLLLGTAAWGLSWFAHGASAFALLLALACALRVAWLMLRAPSRGHWLTGGCVVLALAVVVAPWEFYKRASGGNSEVLLKYHLAGVYYAEYGTPALQVIRTAYAGKPVDEILARKLNNLRLLAVPLGDYGEGAIEWRRRDYYHLLFALGVLNLGWLLLPVRRCSARAGRDTRDGQPALGPPALWAGLVLLFWVLVEFGPTAREAQAWVAQGFNPPVAMTILHQGSYAPVLLLAFVAAALLQTLRGRAWQLALALHLGVFAWCYLVTPPLSLPAASFNAGAVVVCVVSGVGLLALGLGYRRSR